jgi:outer membrane immunogenic protein
MRESVIASLSALFFCGPVMAADFSGPRVEAHAGWDRVQAKLSHAGDSISDHDDGVLYGAEVGYDYQIGNLVLGALAGIDGSTTKECVSGGSERACLKAARDFEVGIRAGQALADRALIYLKATYANARVRVGYTDSDFPEDNISAADNRGGFRLGAGVEANVGTQTYVKVEYRYSDYKNYRVDLDGDALQLGLSRHQVLGGVGIRF